MLRCVSELSPGQLTLFLALGASGLFVGCTPRTAAVPLSAEPLDAEPAGARRAQESRDVQRAASSSREAGASSDTAPAASAALVEPAASPVAPENPVVPENKAAAEVKRSESSSDESQLHEFVEFQPLPGDILAMTLTILGDGAVQITPSGFGVESGLDFDLSGSAHRASRSRTLEVTGGEATKLEVTYLAHRFQFEAPGLGEETETSVLQGKTYIVEKSGDTYSFSYPGGGSVSDEEAVELAKEYSDDDADEEEWDSLEELIPEDFSVGDSIELDLEKARPLFGDTVDYIDAARLEYLRVDSVGEVPCGLFRVSGGMTFREEGVELTGTLSGTTCIAYAGMVPLSGQFVGALSADGEQQGAQFDAEGTVRITLTGDYRRGPVE